MSSDQPPSTAEGDSPPVFGRPSAASAQEPLLEPRGSAATAGFRAAGGATDWCTLRAATVNGVRHRLAGDPAQDSFAWAVADSKIALAVTDGVGAIDGSARAASVAALAAVDAAVKADRGDVTDLAIHAANQVVGDGGATTIVVAVAQRDGRVDLARVGDSTAFLVHRDGANWTELFDSPEGDAGTVVVATAAIPADRPDIELTATHLEPEHVLVLASDGIAEPWRDGPATVAPALAALVLAHPSPLGLAAAADFSRQGCHDDRTIVLLWLGG